jgi:hypothetical protein
MGSQGEYCLWKQAWFPVQIDDLHLKCWIPGKNSKNKTSGRSRYKNPYASSQDKSPPSIKLGYILPAFYRMEKLVSTANGQPYICHYSSENCHVLKPPATVALSPQLHTLQSLTRKILRVFYAFKPTKTKKMPPIRQS